MSDDGRVVVWAAVGLAFGIYVFYRGIRRRIDRQLIENTPTSKVRSIAMGPVEIYGTALQPDNIKLNGPFTKKDCVYYKYTIEEYKSNGKNSHWSTIRSEEKSEFFYLRDDTGTVLVNPKDAEIEIPMDFEFSSRLGKGFPLNVQNFLEANKFPTKGLFGINKELRFREWHIAPDDKLYIFGEAKTNPFVGFANAKKNEENIMISKGRHFFYISDQPEKEVLKKFRWKIIGGLFGGATLILGCLFVIFLYFRFL